MTRTVIIGGGLAGGAAAARLASLGAAPLLLERETAAHDKICGEFLSVEAGAHLSALGFDVARLGGARIDRVRLHAGHRSAEAKLPFTATGITRRSLDWALLEHAERRGAEVRRGTAVRRIADGEAVLADGSIGGRLLLATGKHEVRGQPRDTRGTIADLIGFKTFFRATPVLARSLSGAVAVTVFDGGYAGLQCVEGGRLNLCLLIDRHRFRDLGGTWASLFTALLREPGLAALADAEMLLPRPLTISAVPYGFLVRPRADDPLWRLGDQAAVIPSFCGDGMAMALHGGRLAADMVDAGATAAAFQARLRQDVARQVRLATTLQRLAGSRIGRFGLIAGLGAAPGALAALARWTRVTPGAVARATAPA
ncbi:NAD(P)/FAD-dependent oxidoreductase [Polymorphobacter fuscus]|uniref:Electron transfer flavoprotein n=1 Tax=Sandarakinorhabdus fusca TaxID=1439888 RepID=A0A7C9KJ06_9SPHN|nr:FAD-dependent monooxygenase [Polymorphobacter fuscus]KAB7645541.1 electron transfer flavoprotein [Polymorphobacter fuscus]MQT17980.1 electron transfer flavoprotein [Polymorphobacter fuscus]NJC08610.1 flavin-dependent dehydrogenase [Polymorphobacter fuscus]